MAYESTRARPFSAQGQVGVHLPRNDGGLARLNALSFGDPNHPNSLTTGAAQSSGAPGTGSTTAGGTPAAPRTDGMFRPVRLLAASAALNSGIISFMFFSCVSVCCVPCGLYELTSLYRFKRICYISYTQPVLLSESEPKCEGRGAAWGWRWEQGSIETWAASGAAFLGRFTNKTGVRLGSCGVGGWRSRKRATT